MTKNLIKCIEDGKKIKSKCKNAMKISIGNVVTQIDIDMVASANDADFFVTCLGLECLDTYRIYKKNMNWGIKDK